MAQVTGMTAAEIEHELASAVISGVVDSQGRLLLTTRGGAVIVAGMVTSGATEEFVLEQTITVASKTWTIAHNQNTKGLSVQAFTPGGREIDGDVTYPDKNTIVIQFYNPQTGSVRVWGTMNSGTDQAEYLLEQIFNTPAARWTIVHNQGTKALTVMTWNAAGLELEGDVSYPDHNTIQIDFYRPQTGTARVWI